MKHVILMIVLAVLKESYPLNPEILKYDRYMQDFEATGRQLKQEKNKEMNPPIVKREDQSKAYPNEEPPKEKEPEQTTEEEPESEPIDEFYNYKPQIMYDWKYVRNAFAVKDIKFLRYFCMKVHELAGWGKVNVTNDFILDRSSIKYSNPAYFPTDTDFLQYVIQLPKDGNQTRDHFYLTEGLKEDCVFYLIPTSLELNAFELNHHVCGIHHALRGSKKITDPAAGAAR